ncbi:MAG: putative addiction module antidote protein [Aquabacterium sp.]|nr:MAG: putative addiction module antidote protein [Aquabacterium sp.]
MSKIKLKAFDAADYLSSEEDMQDYLQVALEDGDPKLLAAALGDIAKARGMAQLAADTELSRESLYKSLSGERAPSSETLFEVMKGLGFKLSVRPAHG